MQRSALRAANAMNFGCFSDPVEQKKSMDSRQTSRLCRRFVEETRAHYHRIVSDNSRAAAGRQPCTWTKKNTRVDYPPTCESFRFIAFVQPITQETKPMTNS